MAVICGNRDEVQILYDGTGGVLPSHKQHFYAGISGMDVLDLGCGTGTAARYLVQQNNRVIGITASSEEADIAKSAMTEVYVADLDALREFPFQARQFDAVILGDVLEHLKYPHSLLVLVQTVLKSEGRLYVSLPNVANIAVRLALLGGHFDYEESGILDKTHLRFFTVTTARQLLQDAGYVITDEQYTNWNWSLLPPLVLRLLRLRRLEQAIRNWLTNMAPGLCATQVMLTGKLRGQQS